MSRLVNVTIKVPIELKKRMKEVNINWSEYLRGVIEAKVREELAKKASRRLEEIQSRVKEIPTEEIVKWIREDRQRD
uniref:VapB-type antitoxin n=1 Tax=Thermofilum adornatum TaxID=1365176 RepID=A0A7C1CGU9_9CREN